ncbi:MAG: DUF1573 domain-containing protein [Planctomycetales bacterium]
MDGARFGRQSRLASVVLALVPLAWGVVAQAIGPVSRPMAAPPSRPPLAFAQHLVDLGKVAPSEEVFARFEFINRGKKALTITKLEPSCGCLQPELKQKIFAPHESGRFLLRVQTANQTAGAKEYRVKVHYHDSEPREADVTFRVELPENQVFIRPRALIVSNQGSSEPTTWDAEIIDRRETPLSIRQITCPRRGVVLVEEGATRVDDEGHTHIALRLTIPGNLPPGRIDTVVEILTEDQEYKRLRLPLLIESHPQPDLVRKRQPIFDPLVETAGAVEEVDDEPATESPTSPKNPD